MKFQIRAELPAIAKLRDRLGRFLAASRLGFAERDRMEMILALDEAATNIVLHGYRNGGGIIDVEYEQEAEGLVIRMWDDGVRRDACNCVGLPTGQVGEGGMGTGIIGRSFTSVDYSSTSDGRNVLVLRRRVGHGQWTQPR
jgi:serine/threonine-protein kinase RsbW